MAAGMWSSVVCEWRADLRAMSGLKERATVGSCTNKCSVFQ